MQDLSEWVVGPDDDVARGELDLGFQPVLVAPTEASGLDDVLGSCEDTGSVSDQNSLSLKKHQLTFLERTEIPAVSLGLDKKLSKGVATAAVRLQHLANLVLIGRASN